MLSDCFAKCMVGSLKPIAVFGVVQACFRTLVRNPSIGITPIMHHFGGKEWEKWNGELRDAIILQQVKSGHSAGSWLPNRELDGMAGGRLYTTAMMTMTLDVYYRHMPLYTDQVLSDDFEL